MPLHGDTASLFDRARDQRAEGIQAAEEHAKRELMNLWWHSLMEYLEESREFFVDDFQAAMSAAGLPPLREGRSLGPLVLRAARLGMIEKTDRTRPSVRSHLQIKPIWRSLRFNPEAVGG